MSIKSVISTATTEEKLDQTIFGQTFSNSSDSFTDSEWKNNKIITKIWEYKISYQNYVQL